MKSLFRLMSVFALSALTLASCHKDKVEYPEGEKDQTENIGYLSFGSFSATVMEDTEIIDDSTRAEGNVDINTFNVLIERKVEEGYETVATYVYSELPEEAIALEGGSYRLTIYSAEMVGAEWERPIYGAVREFDIVRLQTTELKDIVCRLANIKVTVNYNAEIRDQLDAAYTTMTVAIGENSLPYGMSEVRPGYFQPTGETSTMKLTLNCRYTGQTKDIVMTNTIPNVKAAQWHDITVSINHAADGTASIGVVCDTWTYEETVIFDSEHYDLEGLKETVLPDDTDMPVIKWENHDLSEEFKLSDGDFDAEGNYTNSINIDVEAKTPIKSLIVEVASTSSDFMSEYTSDLPASIDLCTTTLSDYKLSSFGYTKVGSDVKSVRIKFGKQAQLMRAFAGTHTYTIKAVDTNGHESVASLAVSAGSSVPPTIVWDGYDITATHTYFPGMTCDLMVSAPSTIADFIVNIVSQDLTDEELQGVGLAANFSLVTGTQYFGGLSTLGFPVGDEVKGKTELNLSITTFLGLLSAQFPGDHNFEMTVVDASGNVVTETIKLHFE